MTIMPSRRTFLGLAAGLAAGAVLPGCGNDSASAGSDGLPGRVRIGTMAPYVELAILEQQGILQRVIEDAGHDIELEWQPLLSMVPMATALAGGSIDIGHSAAPVAAIAGGQKLTIVATFEHNVNGSGFLVAKGSDIKEPADLRGRNVGAPTTTPSRQLELILQAGGLTVDDVTLKALEANVGVAGLVNGAVEAYSAFDPYKTQAIMDGHAEELDVGDAKIQSYIPVTVNTDFLDRHPEAVRLYLTALNEAIAWSYDNPEETAAIYAESNKIDGEPARLTLENRDRELLVPNEDFIADVTAEAEFLQRSGSIENLPDWTESIDDTIVTEVLAS